MFAKEPHEGLISAAGVDAGIVGEAFDEQMHILSDLLLSLGAEFFVGTGLAKEASLGWLIALAQLGTQGLKARRCMAFECCKQAFDGDGEQPRATEAGHVTKQVCAIEALFTDIDFQCFA